MPPTHMHMRMFTCTHAHTREHMHTRANAHTRTCVHPQEAYHLQTFGDFLDRQALRGVATCPFVYRQISSKRYVAHGQR
jgi:hypothetical protein